MMDRKSQKLTNILLFIITCIFVLGFLCAVGKFVWGHGKYNGKFDGCKMNGKEMRYEKGCKGEEGGCPFADEKVDVVTNEIE